MNPNEGKMENLGGASRDGVSLLRSLLQDDLDNAAQCCGWLRGSEVVELTPVDSSNVAAIGYYAELRLLRVLFRDGALYDYPDTAPDLYAALMEAESKGRFIRQLRNGVRHAVTAPDTARPVPAAHRELDSYEPDDCCDGPLIHALRSGALATATAWACPKCGCEWKPRQVGAVRHWRPHPVVEVIRAR